MHSLKKSLFIFVTGILLALFSLAGLDYAKHAIALSKIKEVPGACMHGAHIKLYKKGFYVHIDKLTYNGISMHPVRLRVPFFYMSKVRVRARDIRSAGFSSAKLKGTVHFNGDTINIDYFYARDNTFYVGETVLTNYDVSGKATITEDKIGFSLHGTTLKHKQKDLFDITCFGSLAHYMQAHRKGDIRIKVSHMDALVALVLAHSDTMKGWQKQLLIQSLKGQDVMIPLDIRGSFVYIGSIKVFELPIHD